MLTGTSQWLFSRVLQRKFTSASSGVEYAGIGGKQRP